MTRKVEVVPHDSNWCHEFDRESAQLLLAFGENAIEIYHIGSTSISTIYAKPIIDILIAVKDLHKVDDRTPAISALGYVAMGEHGITRRRFFRKDNSAGIRTHHIHTFEIGSAQIDRHLAFRDYLSAHPELAQTYSQLKQQLARQYPTDIERYMDGKNGFIQEIDRQAAQWRSNGTSI
jgi:GrpB-like predicted nucleotidyltransferase (UPF0157 family)